MIGNIAPIINANTVITSATRVTGRRQPAFTRRRIAEIRVPAWLMPIQNTKLVRYRAQKLGQRLPLTPMPYHSWYAHAAAPQATTVPVASAMAQNQTDVFITG